MSTSEKIVNPPRQIIRFDGSEVPNVSKIENSNALVLLTPKAGNESIYNLEKADMVDYSWTEKYYGGQLLAVHTAYNYIAYAVKAAGDRDMIRVLDYSTNPCQKRTLETFEEPVEDIAFAYKKDPVLLAFITLKGCIYVYRIIKVNVYGMNFDAVLHARIIRTANTHDIRVPLTLSWCNFIPNDDDDDDDDDDCDELDFSEVLVVTFGKLAELWNIKTVQSKYGSDVLKVGIIGRDYVRIDTAGALILRGSLSPDGTTAYFIYDDGCVRFYRIVFDEDDVVEFQYEWNPHNGSAVTMLYFLDNQENPAVEFWRFAITGTDYNTKIKVWGCNPWTTLQNLTFKGDSDIAIRFQNVLDSTAKYLLLYDNTYKTMYVLHISKTEKRASILYIAEFYLASDISKFGIAGISSYSDEIPLKNRIDVFFVLARGIQRSALKYSLSKCWNVTGNGTDLREDEFGDKEENENDQQWVIFDNKQDTQEPLVSLEHDRSSFDEQQIAPVVGSVNDLSNGIKQINTQQAATSIDAFQNMLSSNFDRLLERINENEKRLPKLLNDEVHKVLNKTLEEKILPRLNATICNEVNNAKKELNATLDNRMDMILGIVEDKLSNISNEKALRKAVNSTLTATILPPLSETINEVHTNMSSVENQLRKDLPNQIKNSFFNETKTLIDIFKKRADAIIQMNAERKDNAEEKICETIDKINDKMDGLCKSVDSIQPAVINRTETLIKAQNDAVKTNFDKLSKRVNTMDNARFKEYIVRLVLSGQMNDAFQKVLALHNPSMLIFLCEKVDVDFVFSNESKMSQQVILSLTHQLASDIAVKTDLKLRFLERAVMRIDPSDQGINKELFPKLISFVLDKLNDLLRDKPRDYKYQRSVSLLINTFSHYRTARQLPASSGDTK